MRDSNHCGLAPEAAFLIAAFCAIVFLLTVCADLALAIRGPKNQLGLYVHLCFCVMGGIYGVYILCIQPHVFL